MNRTSGLAHVWCPCFMSLLEKTIPLPRLLDKLYLAFPSGGVLYQFYVSCKDKT